MRIVCANHSSYPVVGDGDALAASLLAQADAGLDIVTDGQTDSTDPITPLLAPLAGVRLGDPAPLPAGLGVAPLPIVEGKLRRHGALRVAAYRRAVALAARPVKVVLVGPYTLAQAARIATTAYRGADDLAADLATLLAVEVAALIAAGAPVIQVDEPAILAHPNDVRLLRTLLEPLYDAAGGSARVIVSTYGRDAARSYAQLNTLPADVIALDCATDPALCDEIESHGSGKPLALGILDGSADCAASELAARVRRCLRRYPFDELILQPARGLGGCSPDAARLALIRLTEVRDQVGT